MKTNFIRVHLIRMLTEMCIDFDYGCTRDILIKFDNPIDIKFFKLSGLSSRGIPINDKGFYVNWAVLTNIEILSIYNCVKSGECKIN